MDNVLGIELRQFQWNVSYGNEKDGRVSLYIQLRSSFYHGITEEKNA